MKFKDFILLEEMFKSDKGYSTEQKQIGSTIVFDIDTEEARDYRFIFKKKSNGTYIAELGFKHGDQDNIQQIKGDFYDANKLISTMTGIFTGFYMTKQDANIIEYKFGNSVDKSYKLLFYSIVKKELKTYFKFDDDITSNISDSNLIKLYRNSFNH